MQQFKIETLDDIMELEQQYENLLGHHFYVTYRYVTNYENVNDIENELKKLSKIYLTKLDTIQKCEDALERLEIINDRVLEKIKKDHNEDMTKNEKIWDEMRKEWWLRDSASTPKSRELNFRFTQEILEKRKSIAWYRHRDFRNNVSHKISDIKYRH